MKKAILKITTNSEEEFQATAEVLGACLAPYFEGGDKKTLRIGLYGQHNVGKSTFQRHIAEPILFNRPIARLRLQDGFKVADYKHSEIVTSDGKTLQAIFVDLRGMAFGRRKGSYRLPKREHAGPTFIQHPKRKMRFHIKIAFSFSRKEVEAYTGPPHRKYRYCRIRIVRLSLDEAAFPVRKMIGDLGAKNILVVRMPS